MERRSPTPRAAAIWTSSKFLLDRGADPNVPQEHMAPHGAPLYKAVTNGDYEMAKLLLEHGAHPNQPMESSADTVWIAIRDRNTRMLELLASHGAVWEIPIDLGVLLSYNRIVKTGLVTHDGHSRILQRHRRGDAAARRRSVARRRCRGAD